MFEQNVELDQAGPLVTARVLTPLLSLAETQDITGELSERMRYDNARLFVLDLAEVEFMDSGCIGGLVQFLQDVEHIHGRIALANCQKNVASLFEVTRLDRVFQLYDCTEDAQEALTAA
jgi:anti-sigma B factor antagonist